MRRLAAALERGWYGRRPIFWLIPLAGLYGLVVACRRLAYRRGWFRSTTVGVPVWVVGNITVGGSGKTPLIIALVERLAAHGLRVGVVSRGYGGHSDRYPLTVRDDTSPRLAGDEPVLIARRTGVRVVVDPQRVRAARKMIDEHRPDVILADDGLQHYALARDVEIAITDAQRGLGNRWLLPAGPLREPVSRLETVNLQLVNGELGDFWLEADMAYALTHAAKRELSSFSGTSVHAVAGIGNPARFFTMLRAIGLSIIEHPMPDHHRYRPADIQFDDDHPVLLTEKDAVKCASFAAANHWAVPVRTRLSDSCGERIDALIATLAARNRGRGAAPDGDRTRTTDIASL